MGAFYNSIAALGRRPEAVREVLVRWLGLRGFELSADPVLFDLDGALERSAFLVWNERWTIVFFSHYEEEWRLIHELMEHDQPVLYTWVYDSDVWGYDHFESGRLVGSFSSNPREHCSFAEEPQVPDPRPEIVPEALIRSFALGDVATELKRQHQRRAAFQEDVCRELCRLVGADAALASFDDLERGAAEVLEGWQSEQLLFARTRRESMPTVDLHSYPLSRWQPDPIAFPPTGEVEISAEILTELRRLHRRRRLFLLWLKPAAWLAGAWRRLRRGGRWLGDRLLNPPTPAPAVSLPPSLNPFRVEGRELINDRHGCRLRLAEGIEPASATSKPASVFAFAHGAMHVTCGARRLSEIDEVLRLPARSQTVRDEGYWVGPLQARELLLELPPRSLAGSSGPTFLGMHIVGTKRAFYVFVYRYSGRLTRDQEEALRKTVESFRVDP